MFYPWLCLGEVSFLVLGHNELKEEEYHTSQKQAPRFTDRLWLVCFNGPFPVFSDDRTIRWGKDKHLLRQEGKSQQGPPNCRTNESEERLGLVPLDDVEQQTECDSRQNLRSAVRTPEGVTSTSPRSPRVLSFPHRHLRGRKGDQGFREALGILNLGGPLVGGEETPELGIKWMSGDVQVCWGRGWRWGEVGSHIRLKLPKRPPHRSSLFGNSARFLCPSLWPTSSYQTGYRIQ